MQDAEVKEQEPEEQGEEIEVVEEQQEDEKVDTKTTNQEEKENTTDDQDLSEYSESVKKRISKLTNRFREEERQKQSALEYAESIKKQNEELKAKLDKLDTTYVGEFDNRVSAQAQAAKEAYKKALEAGDADALYEAQQNISRVAMEEKKQWEDLGYVLTPEKTKPPMKKDSEKYAEYLATKEKAKQASIARGKALGAMAKS